MLQKADALPTRSARAEPPKLGSAPRRLTVLSSRNPDTWARQTTRDPFGHRWHAYISWTLAGVLGQRPVAYGAEIGSLSNHGDMQIEARRITRVACPAIRD